MKLMIYIFNQLNNYSKIIMWKLLYRKRIVIERPCHLNNVNIEIKKDGLLDIKKNFRVRRYSNFLIKGGILNVGENCFLNRNVSITCLNKIRIGNGVKIANNVVIVDHDHDYKNNLNDFKIGEVLIGDNVWIGANVVILKDTKIGDNSIIGAGCVVKGIYPNNSVILGQLAYTRKGQ